MTTQNGPSVTGKIKYFNFWEKPGYNRVNSAANVGLCGCNILPRQFKKQFSPAGKRVPCGFAARAILPGWTTGNCIPLSLHSLRSRQPLNTSLDLIADLPHLLKASSLRVGKRPVVSPQAWNVWTLVSA